MKSPLSIRRSWFWILAATLFLPAWGQERVPLPAILVHAEEPAPARPAFPSELVEFEPAAPESIFAAQGPGHWDVKLRERGWILREGDVWRMWYTGYDGTREGIRLLGYATSPDGLKWTPHADNPLIRDHWVEDMQVVKHNGTYYMFAEGLNDQSQLLTSADGVHWKREGTLDIRTTDGKPLTAGPFGTPTAWFENGVWYLFYERRDEGVWLATSRDMQVWTNRQDEPVLVPGPGEYDQVMIALNQIIRHEGRYYAYFHGSGTAQPPRTWTTDIAVSTDLVHWKKYDKNPLVPGNTSSGIVVHDGRQFRLYTMHGQVDVYFPRKPAD